ncbi:MAG: dephospho-CoA kinase [Nitrospira sp.]|nr:dephospho-CoA kinase [Nitrospira sp.]
MTMLLLGLTGGLASGQTTVAGLFQECGALVIHADQLACIVVEPGKAAWKDIVKKFGMDVLQADRTINRPLLARMVFDNPGNLAKLNRIVHPRIAREQARRTQALLNQHPDAIIVYDAALLFEAQAHRRMDRVLVVTATRAVQIARARQRDGLTRRDALGRIRGQLPLADKRRRADYVLNGMLPVPQLRTQVRQLYQELLQEATLRRQMKPVRTRSQVMRGSLNG